MLLTFRSASVRYHSHCWRSSIHHASNNARHGRLAWKPATSIVHHYPKAKFDRPEDHTVKVWLPSRGLGEPYTYSPLPQDSSTIRLVELLPGQSGRIRCKIHHSNRTESSGPRTPYEALSYTWNTRGASEFIWCDDKVLPVSSNVYNALHRIRKTDTSKMLWVDAICIDQSCIQERNQQVGLMRFIYNRATQVVPWLGDASKYTRLAFDLINTIVSNTTCTNGDLRADPGAIWDNRAMANMGLPHFPSPQWQALAKLFERPYFQRVWVVQELAVASSAIARCGALTIPWDRIEYVARLLVSTGWIGSLKNVYGIKTRPAFVRTISNCRLSFHELQGGPGIPLSLLLCSGRRFQATDPRDKIIALMGLANNAGPDKSSSIVPDYSKSIVDLYRDITGHLITGERSLTLLSSVEDVQDRQIRELPSWVPDYSVWQRVSMLGLPIGQRTFSAAGETHASTRWSEGSPFLAVDGFHQDEVQSVSLESLKDRDFMRIVRQWLNMAEPLMSRGTISKDAFWRTLIGNNGGYMYPAPEQYGDHFASYLSIAALPKTDYLEALFIKQAGDSNEANPLLYQASLAYVAPNRKFFTTTKGFIGLGPRSMRPGDSVCIFSGGRVPFVLREDGDQHRLIGESYIHGLMEGQAIHNETKFREFLIR
ncbi:MAG: hypothetical protein Q9187_004543 [Circinaria calcarea]